MLRVEMMVGVYSLSLTRGLLIQILQTTFQQYIIHVLFILWFPRFSDYKDLFLLLLLILIHSLISLLVDSIVKFLARSN